MVAQTESPWGEASGLKKIYDQMASAFAQLRPYIAGVPTYPYGLWSWTIGAAQNTDLDCFDQERFAALAPSLQYLQPELVSAAFALPVYYQRKLGLSNPSYLA